MRDGGTTAAREDGAQEHQPRGCHLPVALSENEIAVAFVPLSPCLKIELAFHLLLRSPTNSFQ